MNLTNNLKVKSVWLPSEYFEIDDKNAATASRIIRDALDEKAIKEDDPENKSRKFKYYIPFWA